MYDYIETSFHIDSHMGIIIADYNNLGIDG